MTAICPAGPPKLKAATRSQTFSASEKLMPCARGAAGEGFGFVDMDVACGDGLWWLISHHVHPRSHSFVRRRPGYPGADHRARRNGGAAGPGARCRRAQGDRGHIAHSRRTRRGARDRARGAQGRGRGRHGDRAHRHRGRDQCRRALSGEPRARRPRSPMRLCARACPWCPVAPRSPRRWRFPRAASAC